MEKNILRLIACLTMCFISCSVVGLGQSYPIYSYVVPTGGYAPNGNVMQMQDSINGSWALTYDNLNRLTGGAVQPVTGQTQSLCWTYDSFGNRTNQMVSSDQISIDSTGNCSTPITATYTLNKVAYDTYNHITATSLLPTLPSGYYDNSGNIGSDGTYQHLYDDEGRLCAVGNVPIPGGGFVGTLYIYNAEGQRVAKGKISQPTCDRSLNGFNPSAATTALYILDQAGQQVSELDGQGSWKHTNVYLGGQVLATYDPQGVHFNITDALETKRLQASSGGQAELNCLSLPFGDGPDCAMLGQLSEATEQRFTGKERDTESGLDYFGARYYASSMGRFMSADWSDAPVPVPFATLSNPQSLNLYGYVGNNPLSHADADGHCCVDDFKADRTDSQRTNAPLTADEKAGMSRAWHESGLGQFIDNHPMLSNLAGQAALAIITRGEGEGVAMPRLTEGGEAVPSAPSMGAAQRQAMQEQGIPTSQQPTTQTSTPAGKQYTYETPKPGGGTETKLVQRNTGTDSSHPGQPHVEAGSPKANGQTDSIGRPRLDSNKTKVNVKKPDGQ